MKETNKTKVADVIDELTQDLVRELFDYRDGNLYRRIPKGRSKIGDLVGNVMNSGYRRVGINYKSYYAHRLIFLYHYGYLPEFLDHIDGNPLNNKIDNLREATSQENLRSQKKSKSYNGKSTSSIYKGVSWDKRSKKWVSHIQIGGKKKHLGYFISEIDAAQAYDCAAVKAFGEFAKINEVNIYE